MMIKNKNMMQFQCKIVDTFSLVSLLIVSLFLTFFDNICLPSFYFLKNLGITFDLESVRMYFKNFVCIKRIYFFKEYSADYPLDQKNILIILSFFFALIFV